MKVSSTIGGLAGAIALTIVNEAVKKINRNAPRLDLLGQNALARFMKGNDILSKTTKQLFPLAGDLVSNSLFYAMSRGKNRESTYLRGAMLGLGAGVGAVTLPETMGLPSAPTARTNETKLLTVAWYLVGGLVAAAVINAIDNYEKPTTDELAKTTVQKSKSAVKDVIKQIAQTV